MVVMTSLLPGLSHIASDYDAVLCDVWGVIHDGRRAFAGAVEALQQFRKRYGLVVLITNAPVPKERVTRLFPKLGVPEDCYDDVVTSGDATRTELKRFAPGPVYRIGLAEDMSVYAGIDLAFSNDPAVAKVVCCTSLREFPHGTPEPYRDELNQLAAHGLAMICANPDVQFKHGDKLVWSAGALAAIYEQAGGQVIRPGKPDDAIYRLALERIAAIGGKAVAPARTLGIGDGPATDVVGAMRQGMDALFIGSGIHGHVVNAGEGLLASAQQVLAADGATAKYVMHELGW
jgi:HAD superfamily hydrolase (TIGR01459 family)